MNGAQNEQDAAVREDQATNENTQQAAAGNMPPNPSPPRSNYDDPRWQEFPEGRRERRERRSSSGLPYKSPALASVLSMMPGLGQIYLGYYKLGFQNMLIMAATIVMLSSGIARGFEPLFGIFLGFFWLYNMIDANRRAHHINRALDGAAEGVDPDKLELPTMEGSRPAGVILIVVGALIFMDLKLGVSLEWLEDFWPLALVGMGGWLIFKGRKK